VYGLHLSGEARAVINIIGNVVATLIVGKWEGNFDAVKADAALRGT